MFPPLILPAGTLFKTSICICLLVCSISVFPFLPAVVFDYLAAVLSDVLHCQRDPLPLCLALLQYDKELVASNVSDSLHPSVVQLHHYYSKWLPQQCREELVSCERALVRNQYKCCRYSVCEIQLFLWYSLILISAKQWSCHCARRSLTL